MYPLRWNGVQGQVGTYELLKLNRATEKRSEEKSAEEIEEIAQENGM